MSWLDLTRVPEAEVMDDSGEVQAYSSAAGEAYLSKIDDTFVEHVLRLIGPSPGWAVDIGCGPGQIVRKLAERLPKWKFWGIDRSPAMLRRAVEARDSSESARAAKENAHFSIGDASSLPFCDGTFDLVLCNSVLHHIGDPGRLFAEIRRVAKPAGAILLRDLRRPSRIAYPFHVRWYGRHYEGEMYKLYSDSVRAAYTRAELSAMLRSGLIPGAHVFTYNSTHLGFERSARPTN
jgi:ubiquinone/menaquinone biosynthesis C-methylase UbiE